jgi:hypothetical protein
MYNRSIKRTSNKKTRKGKYRLQSGGKTQENISTNNKFLKTKKIAVKRQGQVQGPGQRQRQKQVQGPPHKKSKMEKFRTDGDNTFESNMSANVDRCMCIDTNNKILSRCRDKVVSGTDFCAKHANCRSKLSEFLSGYEPNYDPNKWNDPYVEGSHNCYSYFLDKRVPAVKEKCRSICTKKNKKDCPNNDSDCTDLKPQPGDFSLVKKRGTTSNKERVYKCPNMESKILADNKVLLPVEFNQKCPRNYYKGAMVVDPNHTFHFYRQDKDGLWSHKPGISPISRVDADKKPIYVPHFANRNYTKDKEEDDEDAIDYTDFCGYYCIPNSNYMDLNLA